MANKTIPKRKIIQYYKRFANGEQNIELTKLGTIGEACTLFSGQRNNVYNLIDFMINEYAIGLTEDQLYGRNGLVSLLEPYQRNYNSIMNRLMDHVENCTNGIAMVEDGSVDVDELCEEGLYSGKVFVYRQGASVPVIVKDKLDTLQYVSAAEYHFDMMRTISENFCKQAIKENNLKMLRNARFVAMDETEASYEVIKPNP